MPYSVTRSYLRRRTAAMAFSGAFGGGIVARLSLSVGLVLIFLLPTGAHAVLDARTGFHDIKAIPEFQPIRWLWFVGLGLLVLLIGLYLYRRRRRVTELTPQFVPVPPYEEARGSLAELRISIANHRIAVRDIGASVSKLVRRYIDRRLLKQGVFGSREDASGLDLTLWEVAKLFNAKGVDIGVKQREEATAIVKRMAADVDYLEFAENSEQLYTAASAEIENLLVTTESLLEMVHVWELNTHDSTPVDGQTELNAAQETSDLPTGKIQEVV